MIAFRKVLILSHRYLGIALSVLFVIWFLSGIGMIYARGMPQLTPELRRARLPALDVSRVRLAPLEAAMKSVPGPPAAAVLMSIMGRPAYRFTGSGLGMIFADTGELVGEIGTPEALAIASQFMNVPVTKMRHVGLIDTADQWTIAQRGILPLHKIIVDDADRSELYVSPDLVEVVVYTTRGSRALAWVAAIPHWLYFAPLRLNDALWRKVVLWTSGLGAVLAFMGLLLAMTQFSPSRPFQLRRLGSYIPYAGWMRWHYITGVIFGVFTLTWVFSGMLSLEPWDYVSRDGLGAGMEEAFTGGDLDLTPFPMMQAEAWNAVLRGRRATEVEFVRVQGDPYYHVHGVEAHPILLAVNPLRTMPPFSIESLMARVKEANPDVPIVESRLLSEYDGYYYVRDPKGPLPVLRVKFADPARTWFYLDPAMSQIVARLTRQERIERWIYHGLHSLDFPFWYHSRPAWDIGVIALALGGAASSGIGLFVGFRRLIRGVKRRM